MKTALKLITPIVSENPLPLDVVRVFERADLTIDHSTLDAGPASIECRFDDAFSVPDLLKKTLQAEQQGFNAVVVNCMADSGLAALREAVSIPVVATAQTAMHVASLLGGGFGYIGLLEKCRAQATDLAAVYGLENRLVAYASIDTKVLAITEHEETVADKLGEAAVNMIRQHHVGSIILGCTGFVNCAEKMQARVVSEGLSAQIINPLPLAIHLADALVKAGLSHSKGTYPDPDTKRVEQLMAVNNG